MSSAVMMNMAGEVVGKQPRRQLSGGELNNQSGLSRKMADMLAGDLGMTMQSTSSHSTSSYSDDGSRIRSGKENNGKTKRRSRSKGRKSKSKKSSTADEQNEEDYVEFEVQIIDNEDGQEENQSSRRGRRSRRRGSNQSTSSSVSGTSSRSSSRDSSKSSRSKSSSGGAKSLFKKMLSRKSKQEKGLSRSTSGGELEDLQTSQRKLMMEQSKAEKRSTRSLSPKRAGSSRKLQPRPPPTKKRGTSPKPPPKASSAGSARRMPSMQPRGQQTAVDDEDNYYSVLGIASNATPKELKNAYRRKALEYHPDKNSSKEATIMFAQITKAYQVLSDEDTRAVYDDQQKRNLLRVRPQQPRRRMRSGSEGEINSLDSKSEHIPRNRPPRSAGKSDPLSSASYHGSSSSKSGDLKRGRRPPPPNKLKRSMSAPRGSLNNRDGPSKPASFSSKHRANLTGGHRQNSSRSLRSAPSDDENGDFKLSRSRQNSSRSLMSKESGVGNHSSHPDELQRLANKKPGKALDMGGPPPAPVRKPSPNPGRPGSIRRNVSADPSVPPSRPKSIRRNLSADPSQPSSRPKSIRRNMSADPNERPKSIRRNLSAGELEQSSSFRGLGNGSGGSRSSQDLWLAGSNKSNSKNKSPPGANAKFSIAKTDVKPMSSRIKNLLLPSKSKKLPKEETLSKPKMLSKRSQSLPTPQAPPPPPPPNPARTPPGMMRRMQRAGTRNSVLASLQAEYEQANATLQKERQQFQQQQPKSRQAAPPPVKAPLQQMVDFVPGMQSRTQARTAPAPQPPKEPIIVLPPTKRKIDIDDIFNDLNEGKEYMSPKKKSSDRKSKTVTAADLSASLDDIFKALNEELTDDEDDDDNEKNRSHGSFWDSSSDEGSDSDSDKSFNSDDVSWDHYEPPRAENAYQYFMPQVDESRNIEAEMEERVQALVYKILDARKQVEVSAEDNSAQSEIERLRRAMEQEQREMAVEYRRDLLTGYQEEAAIEAEIEKRKFLKEKAELEEEQRALQQMLKDVTSQVDYLNQENDQLQAKSDNQYQEFQSVGAYIQEETAQNKSLSETEEKLRGIYNGSVDMILAEKLKVLHRHCLYKCVKAVQDSEKYDHELFEQVMQELKEVESEVGNEVHDLSRLEELPRATTINVVQIESKLDEELQSIAESDDEYSIESEEEEDRPEEPATDYSEVLSKLSADLGEKHYSTLRDNKEILFTILKLLDKNGTGEIESGEFQVGLGLLNRRLPAELQFQNPMILFEALDVNRAGIVDLDDFADIFRLNDVTFDLKFM